MLPPPLQRLANQAFSPPTPRQLQFMHAEPIYDTQVYVPKKQAAMDICNATFITPCGSRPHDSELAEHAFLRDHNRASNQNGKVNKTGELAQCVDNPRDCCSNFLSRSLTTRNEFLSPARVPGSFEGCEKSDTDCFSMLSARSTQCRGMLACRLKQTLPKQRG